DPDPRNRGSSGNELLLDRSRLPLAALTDSEGRFTLDGLPRDSHVGLMVTDPRFAHRWFHCATLDKPEIDRLNQTRQVPEPSKLLADGFTVTLQPRRLLRG